MAASGPSDDRSVPDLDALAQDAEFFRSLVDNGSDAIVTIDEHSTIRYANQAVERVFGYAPEDLIGEKLTAVMPERFCADHFDAVDRYLDTGERQLDWSNIELPAEHADGHEIPLSITFEEHVHEDDRVFSGIMRDISARKSYEETLESLQATARALMEARTSSAIGDCAVDAAVDVIGFPLASLYRHDAASNVLRPAAQSDDAVDLFGEAPTLADGSLAWQAFQSGDPAEYHEDDDRDVPVHRPDGPVAAEYAVPLGDHGVLLVADTDTANFDDHTKHLVRILAANTEAALARAEREAERERQNERLERFASIVSHDLRDPIQSARATTALAKAGDETALDDLETIFDRMEELVEDVLTLAKHGQAVGETEPVSLAAVADDAWSTAGTDDATLDVDPDLPTLQADGERLRTLLENLFRNSVTHGGDAVTVTLGPTDDGFYVADDGAGFGDADPEQLFDYGYTTSEDGTGFGLSIVRDVVTAHGWTIEASESAAGGARFDVHPR
ncbi:PAS domain-containing sensor histidine kinase [Halobacterium jilantaiense]|uniref:histidine kinase n=1 Tax=Halobacterium jilantaiense TaxID=355548 RepID=A0A1I0Q4K3_9EURY|nr:PAS domain S-box protein [Halobacterium jilantaiense]SEW21717.1 PAS/PAC sensor signal transduction histidine kinase [Halobacterium jilantaiense]